MGRIILKRSFNDAFSIATSSSPDSTATLIICNVGTTSLVLAISIAYLPFANSNMRSYMRPTKWVTLSLGIALK